MAITKVDIPASLKNYTVTDRGCWKYNGCVNQDGYASIRFRGQLYGGHRLSWELYREKIPLGMSVLHRCDNPSCINPGHLFLGTQLENIADRESKNRGNTRKLSAKDIARVREACLFGAEQKTLAETYGVSRALICIVAGGKYRPGAPWQL